MFDPDRRHLIAYLAAAAVLVVMVVRLIGHQRGPEPIPTISPAAPAAGKVAPRRPASVGAGVAGKIWVDVVGAVRKPGLYSLPAGSRVAAAINRAGGVGSRAERTAVNLAAKLADGQQVMVPVRGRVPATVAAPGAAASATSPSATPASAGSSAPVSLSGASQEQLEQLDGIGPGLAGRIIEYREAHGGFRSVDELQEVSGIGDKRFQALKGRIAP